MCTACLQCLYPFIHFSGLSRRSLCGFRGLGPISKTVHIPRFLKQSLIRSVAMSTQGLEEGCVVTELRRSPGSNTKDSWETRSLQVCNRGCSFTYKCLCNRSPLQLQKQMSCVYCMCVCSY